MHFYIAGASGRNGTIALQTLLARGHSATILVRNPSSSIKPRHNLTIITGTPTSQPDVQRALSTPQPPDVIISTLNQRRVNESNPFSPLSPDSPPDLLATTTKVLLNAISEAFAPLGPNNRPKIIINSSLGVGESWSAMPMLLRWLFSYSTMRYTIADHNEVDKLIRESGLNFVLARPAGLTNGASKPARVLPENGKGLSLVGMISRQSVGEWLVEAAETSEWDRTSPVLVN